VSWQASSFLLLTLTLVAGFAWFERERPPARIVAMVAALAALAVAGRLVFAAIPNVKPTTDIVLFAGYALGAAPGFCVGAITAIVSNIFLSQGPWTVWQMAGWGAVGVSGAVLARMLRGREPNRWVLAGVCGLAGLAFGAWMDVYQWTLGARQDLDSYLVVAGTSLPYNLAHAAGNVVFCLLIGPAFIRALGRYRQRFEVSWRAPVVAASTLVLLLVLAGGAAAATPAERAERYLLGAQNADGGFGAAPRQGSSPLYSGWTGLGLAAAGRNAADVRRRGGRSLASYARRAVRGEGDIGEVERTALLLISAGVDPRDVGGRNLLAEITGKRRANGSVADFVSYTAFGVLVLRGAGERVGRKTIRWLAGSQNEDGGFGLTRAAPSEGDLTGAVLQALAVVGRANSDAARRAVDYLLTKQGTDGGFGLRTDSSNAQSTAYAVQGLLAVGAGRRAVARGLRYLTSLQRRDGSIAFSRTSAQTPVWVTAQALAALERQPLPIAAVPRVKRARAAGAASAPEAGAGGEKGGDEGGGGGSAGGGSSTGPPDKPSKPAAQAAEDAAPAEPPDPAALAMEAADGAAAPAGDRTPGLAAGPAPADDGGAPLWLLMAAVLAALAGGAWYMRRLRGNRPGLSGQGQENPGQPG
jgi:energy-coupling factor transport system substrate-specific component